MSSYFLIAQDNDKDRYTVVFDNNIYPSFVVLEKDVIGMSIIELTAEINRLRDIAEKKKQSEISANIAVELMAECKRIKSV